MIGGLNHLTLSVRDLARSFAFYRDALGFRPLARWSDGAHFLAGETTWVCLTRDDRTREGPLPEYTHVAFSVHADAFEAARARVLEYGASEWKANSSEGHSLYIVDPDGHKLELHVGDWRSRLETCRAAPFESMEFFDEESS